ncbi:hypothetical protein TOPH_01254 [Tolypocladium ophioglossoides CBS 100239]|uniref:Glycoprotein-N-acetylgalactosamine 3-beta-galactosyltransferase 1 n=1 Tax=Tolypocladium ophioglossoides (strain CBS 100239) TaxID=1163406 RepID=A0A0L0NJP0_TOLOC|nr:hypothetical protein TOPH_01254 [Tolypocladium ophioglossoides CBS 100239]
MLAPRVLSRRSVVILTTFSIFITGLLITSSRLGAVCEDGSSCDLSNLRHSLPAFGGADDANYRHQKPPHPNSTDGSEETDNSRSNSECANFPDTSNVLLVMKTGASEAYSKIPNQIITNLKCLPEFMFFSDMAEKVAGYTIHDSLDTVLPEVKLKNSDFDLYHRQQKCPTDQESCNKNHKVGQEAWNLDKYKNIHMAEKTYALRPNYDWYLFVDADTYVVWPTMMKWLEQLDPRDTHYIGSVAYVANFPFGHGGSGYFVSQATMKKFFEGKTGVANRWDERVTKECCGDYMFSLALKTETEIAVKNAWPTINGEKPHTLPYAADEWCQPIVTMHHASAQEVSEIYAFEQERNFSYPMRIKDLYHRFVEDRLRAARDDWDNLSDDVFYLNSSASDYDDWELKRAKKENLSALEMAAHQSFDDCRRACQSLDECFQYRFHNGICAISYTI